jgi:uncharacterized protein (TIGR02145 family)
MSLIFFALKAIGENMLITMLIEKIKCTRSKGKNLYYDYLQDNYITFIPIEKMKRKMKNILFVTLLLIASLNIISAQDGKFQIEGSVLLGDSEENNPQPGTIRWTGLDLEGYNGEKWVSLTSGRSALVMDASGHTYHTMKIGDQFWFTENLRTTKYADSSDINFITDNAQWDGLLTGAYCWFENNNIYDQPHGKLYNWYAVNDDRKLCPSGWRVPSVMDYNILIDFLGGSDIAGGKLKQEGVNTWVAPNTGATNESGFTAVASGSRGFNGAFSTATFGYLAGFWSTNTVSGTEASILSLGTNSDNTDIVAIQKRYGFQVRCIKQ